MDQPTQAQQPNVPNNNHSRKRSSKTMKFSLFVLVGLVVAGVVVGLLYFLIVQMSPTKEYRTDKFSILVPNDGDYKFTKDGDSSFNWIKKVGDKANSYVSVVILNITGASTTNPIEYIDNPGTESKINDTYQKDGLEIKNYSVQKATSGDYNIRKVSYDLFKDNSLFRSYDVLCAVNKDYVYTVTVSAEQNNKLTDLSTSIIDSFKLN